MIPVQAPTTVDAWLQWFDTYKQTACRAFLCTWYHLNALDAEALMNTTRFPVFLHWATVDNPLAYFWHVLVHAVGKQGKRRTYELRQLVAYAQQYRVHIHHAARTAQQVADLLERAAPRQCHLLGWYAQGYDDTQVAAWLGTTSQAVRVARPGVYRALRAQLCPSSHRLPEEGTVTTPAI
jgi:hypothetical protein